MGAIFAGLLAAFPNALIAIGVRLFSEKFVQAILEKTIIYALKEAAALSTNKIDDEFAAMVEKRLTSETGGKDGFV